MALSRQLSFAKRQMPPFDLNPDPGANYGEVFTRRWVVDLIIDLVGYTPAEDLGGRVLVEPSCGTGAFLLPIVERLIASSRRHSRPLESLGPALRAFDLLEANVERARKAVALYLSDAGVAHEPADSLARTWITTGDFLREPHVPRRADFVVGNPPYIRLENVSQNAMADYRQRCPTMRGRADVYVGFIEQGLSLLKPGAVLGYICADRWMRNQYGAELRALISRSYSVDTVITMHDVDAFEEDVQAYPAVVVLRARPQEGAAVVTAGGAFGQADASKVSAWVTESDRPRMSTSTFEGSRVDRWFQGREFWPSCSPSSLALLADLAARYPALEDATTGTRVGIGVATGCDELYLTRDATLVEEERLLPLLRASDTKEGTARWSGTYLVNPWDGQGLVDLRSYPRLRAYYETHAERLRSRHVARQRPAQWYRTIDRVTPDLVNRPKLVLPDLKAAAHPVLDEGGQYPHHNLYYVVSDTWDLEVLGGLLLSDVTNLFIGAYCVRMRGGCYRFQAQYLRQIRLPSPDAIESAHRRALARAFADRDVAAATAVALRVYGLRSLPDVR